MNNWMIGLIRLDNHFGLHIWLPADSACDLVQELKDSFFSLIVRQEQTAFGLQNANQTQLGQVQAFCDQLCPDDQLDIAVVQSLVIALQTVINVVVGVKACQAIMGKYFVHFCGDHFGSKAFVNNIWIMTMRAGVRDLHTKVAQMAHQLVPVGVQGQRHKTINAQCGPAAVVADGCWGSATTVVKEQSLVPAGESLLQGM